jgi:anti-sigma B factor antagonist
MPLFARRLNLETRDSEDLAVVTLPGCRVLGEDDSETVARHLDELVEAGRRKLVLDFSGVRFVPSSLLGRLVALNRRLHAAGGRLLLCNVHPTLYDMFAVTRLHWVLELQTEEGQADGPTGRASGGACPRRPKTAV